MDPGESSEAAARRELYEETGITEAEIGPCVWTQHARFRFAGWKFDQHEHVHVAWTDRIDLSTRSARAGSRRSRPWPSGATAGGASTTCWPATTPCSPAGSASSSPTSWPGSCPSTPLDITHVDPDLDF